ncbi:MAG: sigma-70 family RNA polymerase sigma factor [Elusimicrobiota bacterium]
MDTDCELILRCRADARAFETLMERYKTRIYSFLTGLAGATLADDLFQEFWLKVYRNADRYEARGRAAGWLFRIANNVAMDGLVRQRRGKDHVDISELGESLPDGAPTAHALAERDELRRRLDAALEQLPVEQRQIFLMREYGRMSFREISESLAIPLGTALSRMNYALEKLRSSLEDLDA